MSVFRGKDTDRIREQVFSGCFFTFAILFPILIFIYLVAVGDLASGVAAIFR